MSSELTPYEAESLASGYLPPSAIPKVSPALQRYHGIGAEAGTADAPVPYSLTPAAGAALDSPADREPCPGASDPERLAEWCGFPSAAAMEAACEAHGRALAEASEADARWEAECAALAAEDPEAGL